MDGLALPLKLCDGQTKIVAVTRMFSMLNNSSLAYG